MTVTRHRRKRMYPAHEQEKRDEYFREVGMFLYNDAILLTAVGSLPVRVSAQFNKSRKLGKTHQNILVFCKGNPKKWCSND